MLTFFPRFFLDFHFWTFFLSNFEKKEKILEKKVPAYHKKFLASGAEKIKNFFVTINFKNL
jgi:hypothetical protein